MKILFLSPFSPVPARSGIQQRMAIALDVLAELGEVTVMTSVGDQDAVTGRGVALQDYGRVIVVPPFVGHTPTVRRGLWTRLRAHIFDARPAMVRVFDASEWPPMLASADTASYDLVWVQGLALYGHLRHRALRRVIVDLPDAESSKRWRDLRSRRRLGLDWLLEGLDFLKVRHAERAGRRKDHWFVVCSENDRQGLGPDLERVRVVRNAVAVPSAAPIAEWSSAPTLAFVGTLAYTPNRDAVRFFVDAIFPHIVRAIPDARFHVVGSDPSPEILALAAPPRISIFGSVAEVAPFMRAATVGVVPLRNGAGTRLKILEAMSFGKPVVSTTIGAEGLAVDPGRNILIADEPSVFADRCVALLRDADLRARIGRAGRDFVARYHSLDHAKQDLHHVLDAIQGLDGVDAAREVGTRAS
jgi:glycosyltransferase involved in cell wall biosynthesis